MKIKELYEREPERWERIDDSCFVEEELKEDLPEFGYNDKILDKDGFVDIAVHKDHCFDGRRCWYLAVVYYQNNPIVIVQRAGREGDDHANRFITDEEKYKEALNYFRSQMNEKSYNVCDIDSDIEIDDFYGYNLESQFDWWQYED